MNLYRPADPGPPGLQLVPTLKPFTPGDSSRFDNPGVGYPMEGLGLDRRVGRTGRVDPS